MAVLSVAAKIDATDYGDLSDGGDSGQSAIREIWFGPFASGGTNHFDLRHLMVGTAGYASSDLWNPGSLSGMGDFNGGWFGPGTDPSFSGGVMSFNASDGDRYGVHDLGSDFTSPVYVTFDLRVYSDNGNPDYTDMSDLGGAAAHTDGDGLFDTGDAWRWDGPGNSFGTGPIKDGTTWQTVSVAYSYAPIPPPPAAFHIAS